MSKIDKKRQTITVRLLLENTYILQSTFESSQSTLTTESLRPGRSEKFDDQVNDCWAHCDWRPFINYRSFAQQNDLLPAQQLKFLTWQCLWVFWFQPSSIWPAKIDHYHVSHRIFGIYTLRFITSRFKKKNFLQLFQRLREASILSGRPQPNYQRPHRRRWTMNDRRMT